MSTKNLQSKLNIIGELYKSIDKNITQHLPKHYFNALEDLHQINQSINKLKSYNSNLVTKVILSLSFRQFSKISELTFSK